MAELATLARPYAEAAFQLAAEQGLLPQWSDTLAAMANAVKHPDVASLISNPKLSAAQLTDTFASLVPSVASDSLAKNFVATLVSHERLILLPAIAVQFDKLRAEQEGFADAAVTSAFALADSELSKLVATLERRFKRKIKPHVRIDKELIGGVVVRVGDEVIDSSVRGQLAKMQAALQS